MKLNFRLRSDAHKAQCLEDAMRHIREELGELENITMRSVGTEDNMNAHACHTSTVLKRWSVISGQQDNDMIR